MNNEFYIYLNLKPWTRQWIINKFGDPVKFPAVSIENAEICHHLMRCPINNMPLSRTSQNQVAVVIPWTKKNPLYYNWMRKSSIELIEGMIENSFDRCFKRDIWDLINKNSPRNLSVECWLRENEISMDYYETLLQRINRMLMVYKKKGIYKKNIVN